MEQNPRTRIAMLAGSLAVLLLLLSSGYAGAQSGRGGIQGTWYVALDAAPFGLPPGTNLPGLAQFDVHGTFTIVDGGDFGGPPFDTRDTAQFGTWRHRGGSIEAVSLFLLADAATGAIRSWQKVELVLERNGRDQLSGFANVSTLACDGPAPFPVFGCPDPVEFSEEFVAMPPFDIPVVLRRLRIE